LIYFIFYYASKNFDDMMKKQSTSVIPAQAGIHKKIVLFHEVSVDPRLRGDDNRGRNNKVSSCQRSIFLLLVVCWCYIPLSLVDNAPSLSLINALTLSRASPDGSFRGAFGFFIGACFFGGGFFIGAGSSPRNIFSSSGRAVLDGSGSIP
jgi:hypothetical protein